MPNTFRESDLLFTFPADWVVRKFDSTKAYQSLSGHGLKGVDFIALSPDGRLWLMEVKNYRPRFKNEREYRAKRRPPEELAAHVLTKFKDTQRLLRIVNKSLVGKWWFLLWRRFRTAFPNTNSNYWFWTEAFARLETAENVVHVLWMETPEQNEDYDRAVEAGIRAGLPEGGSLFVVEDDRDEGLPIQVI